MNTTSNKNNSESRWSEIPLNRQEKKILKTRITSADLIVISIDSLLLLIKKLFLPPEFHDFSVRIGMLCQYESWTCSWTIFRKQPPRFVPNTTGIAECFWSQWASPPLWCFLWCTMCAFSRCNSLWLYRWWTFVFIIINISFVLMSGFVLEWGTTPASVWTWTFASWFAVQCCCSSSSSVHGLC